MKQSKYVTPRVAAKQFGVSIDSLRRWASVGKIKAIRTLGGQRRFCIEEYYHKVAKPEEV